MRFSDHCWRSKQEVVPQIILGTNCKKRSRGRPVKTFINQLQDDTGIRTKELGRAMEDEDGWSEVFI